MRDQPSWDVETESDKRYQEIEKKKNQIGLIIKLLIGLLILITIASFIERIRFQRSVPEKTVSGESWNSDWELIGKVLGVDESAFTDDWNLDYNQTLSTASKIYMALYGLGEGREVTFVNNNNKEDTMNVYDAGVYIILEGCDSKEASLAELHSLKELHQAACSTWEVLGSEEEAIYYEYGPKAESDYEAGFICYKEVSGWALVIQLDYSRDSGWDKESAYEAFLSFLDALHYAA